MATIFTDGHLDGLNGIGGVFADSGYSLIQIKGKTITKTYQKKSLTNNEAELLAIFHACDLAKKNDIICSDSQVALTISRTGKSSTDRFQLIAIAIKHIIDKKKLTLQWVPRENNPVT
jgi:ribonuclease HI